MPLTSQKSARLLSDLINPSRLGTACAAEIREERASRSSPPLGKRLRSGRPLSYRFLTNSARMALSTARIITPTSANTASHMFANPRATSTRQASFTPMATIMF